MPELNIEAVMNALYESEISCSISTMWDGGWDVKLGDEVNGFIAQGNFRTLAACAAFLDAKARQLMPESVYAGGRGVCLS